MRNVGGEPKRFACIGTAGATFNSFIIFDTLSAESPSLAMAYPLRVNIVDLFFEQQTTSNLTP
jgi:hypothetical protein